MGSGGSKSAKSKLTTDELETARRALDTVASLEQRMASLEASVCDKVAGPGVGKPHALNDAEYFREEKIKRAKASGPATTSDAVAALCGFFDSSGGRLRVIDLFRRLDSDGNGQIDGAELVRGLQGMGLDLRRDQARELMARLDLDGDRQISSTEFLSQVRIWRREAKRRAEQQGRAAAGAGAGAGPGSAPPSPELREAGGGALGKAAAVGRAVAFFSRNTEDASKLFARIDTAGDGMVDASEMVMGLQMLGLRLRREEAALVIGELDSDGDGKISTAEFLAKVKEWRVSAAGCCCLRVRLGSSKWQLPGFDGAAVFMCAQARPLVPTPPPEPRPSAPPPGRPGQQQAAAAAAAAAAARQGQERAVTAALSGESQRLIIESPWYLPEHSSGFDDIHRDSITRRCGRRPG
jgi:Ca2+-binding EF-hand superfamily protein